MKKYFNIFGKLPMGGQISDLCFCDQDFDGNRDSMGIGGWNNASGKKTIELLPKEDVCFGFVQKKCRKGSELIVGDEVVAIIIKGKPKTNSRTAPIPKARHLVKFVKGKKIEELPFEWSIFISWINENLDLSVIESKSRAVRFIAPKETENHRAELFNDRIKEGKKNEYGQI
jgi:hypothetical protein